MERVARNGHHDYGIGSGAGAVENAVDLSTVFFSTFVMNKLGKICQLGWKGRI